MRNKKSPINTIGIKINRKTNQLYINWNRNSEQINSIIENIELFNIKPSDQLIKTIKQIALRPTKRNIIDTISF